MLKFRNFFSRISVPFKSIWTKSACVSLFLFIASIACIQFKGMNLGIDFTGGYAIDVRILPPQNPDSISSILNEAGMNEVIVQRFFDSSDLTLKVKNQSYSGVQSIKELLEKSYGKNIKFLGSDFIGAQFVDGQIFNSIMILLLSIGAMFLYLWVRFDFFFGIGGIISLVHDVFISLGFISLSGIELDLSAMAAILTIIGYSVNDSVVIYDRIRIISGKNGFIDENVLDSAVNSTLSRTMLTSGTTLLSSLPIIIFCSGSVRSFSLIVFFGIFIGTLSSIFVSAPALLLKKFMTKNA